MVGSTDPRSARRLRRVRFALLALGGLLLGHTAVYAVAFGDGAAFGQQMRLGGHDGYWPVFAGAALAGLAVLAADGVLGLLRAWRGVRSSTLQSAPTSTVRGARESARRGARSSIFVQLAGAHRSAPDYLTEVLDLWGPLFIVVCAAFLTQENAESLIVHGQLPLLGVFTAHLFAAPILALVTGLLAAIGALVRWQTAVLAARARRTAARWERPLATRPHRRWPIESAALAARMALLRQDVGRAPPCGGPVPA